MKPTAISNEYLTLQTEISNKQTEWTKKLDKSVVEKLPFRHKEIPIIAQVTLNIEFELYEQWINELAELLVENNEHLASDLKKLQNKLDQELVKRWADEVLAFNQMYFQSFAEETGIQEWLPYFLAENCIRPFLRIVSEVYTDQLSKIKTKGSCTCCGEPIRLAVLEGKGLKMILCPRCEAKWNQKNIQCSFCGNEDHNSLSYYNVENDNSKKIEVCVKCNGYIKIIDTRKLFKKQTAFILDLTSLHLDFVAQEKGFGTSNNDGEVMS
jgi:FdhE protein